MQRYIAPIVLLTGTLFLGYLYLEDTKQDSKKKNISRSEKKIPYGKLQQYQKETRIKIGLHHKQTEMNKQLNNSEINPTSKNKFHQTELHDGYDSLAEDLADSGSEQAITLDQRMDRFLAERQYYENMEQIAKKAYVDRFISEARKMGYVVEVNDQMEIVNVEEVESR